MRTASTAAYVTIIASVWTSVAPADARGLTVGAAALFYGDNTEFRNPFREGETLFGAAIRVDAEVEMSRTVSLDIGFFGNQRFGGERAFDLARPVLALRVKGRRSVVVFGTLPSAVTVEDRPGGEPVTGPDRTGPHGLVPPLQRETLAFERPYEAGLEWTFVHPRLEQESWLQWQRLNTPEHRERLDAGIRGIWRVSRRIGVPLQTHIVHEGGQLFASGPVRDSLGVASGLMLRTDADRARHDGRPLALTLELLGLWSRFTADREAPDPTRDGGAFFGRAAARRGSWRAHLIVWRGDDFVKDEGDPNYLSVRRDGTRWRGVRDYAEAGIAHGWRVAPGARLEASFRLHRVERHYEYSYRILAVAGTRARLN
jgi:hypothetical protein